MNSWGWTGYAKPAPVKPFRVGKNRRLTRADVDDIVRLRRQGLTLDQISEKYGVSRGTVRYRLIQVMTPSEYAKLTSECHQNGRAILTKNERNQQIVSLRLQGVSFDEIAKQFGLCQTTIIGICFREIPFDTYESVSQRRRWKMSDPEVIDGIKLYRSGLSIREAARQVGVPYSSLWKCMKRGEK